MNTGIDRSFVIRAEPGVISLEGRINFAVTRELLEAFPLAGQGATVSLDFSGMDSLDVSGVNALIKLYLKAREQGRGLRVKGLPPLYGEVFKAGCLTEAFPMEAGAESGTPARIPDGWPWARPVDRLRVEYVPEVALNLNVDSLKVAGPLQGFGHLWEKTYRIPLRGVSVTPAEVIRAFKERFPSYQPAQNRFFPTPAGISPGEIVIINASTPAGPISTGVWVLYAGDEAFTFMTPQGHPESGWVSFTAYEEKGVTMVQIQGFARASDPVFEAGFVMMGSREQERIWKHVLTSLGKHFGVYENVTMEKSCVGCDYQWERAGNIWYNAQIRTMIHTIRKFAGF